MEMETGIISVLPRDDSVRAQLIRIKFLGGNTCINPVSISQSMLFFVCFSSIENHSLWPVLSTCQRADIASLCILCGRLAVEFWGFRVSKRSEVNGLAAGVLGLWVGFRKFRAVCSCLRLIQVAS